ncbi:CaiB/BaiF CoA transferase family protein [Nocardia asiatica]|uniref:CaiB/BaiF CoA transferase family protein n=1 Tax=Nocardia asiatica TaxID=209252 RepID=UPI0002D525CC|nr:CoA transferase [Nocardia asiatica]
MTNDRTSARPFLDGVRVLEITGALAGPYCTTILSDLGAEVIKVEPLTGDGLRNRRAGHTARAIPFDLVHRDKNSFAVDLKTAEGRDIVVELALRCDVLVENFRVGALSALGLGYADLEPVFPDLVYCSISGFGQFGPMREAKGVDLIAQAYGGLMSVTGSEEGTLAKSGFPVSDIGSGMWAAIGVVAALLRARAGGGGAYIDVSLADTIASWSVWEIADFVATNDIPGPLGTAHRLAAPYQAFRCGDGQTLVIGATERSWPALCTVLEIDLSHDERFVIEFERFRHRVPLAEFLEERFATQSRDYWIERLREAGVPCGPVNTIDQVLADPQFEARGMFPRSTDRFGDAPMVNTPIVSDGAPRARRQAPQVGEQTDHILTELGYSPGDIDRLVSAGVVARPVRDIADQLEGTQP